MSVRLTKRPFLGRGLMRAAVALAYLIVFAPVFMIVVTSFFSQQIVSFPPAGLTSHWYVNAWQTPEFLRGLLTSLQIRPSIADRECWYHVFAAAAALCRRAVVFRCHHRARRGPGRTRAGFADWIVPAHVLAKA